MKRGVRRSLVGVNADLESTGVPEKCRLHLAPVKNRRIEAQFNVYARQLLGWQRSRSILREPAAITFRPVAMENENREKKEGAISLMNSRHA